MKSIIRIAVIVMAMLPFAAFAQTKKAGWPELKAFHGYMSSTFHPAEEGNFAPLRVKADSMLAAAKTWQASPIPSDFKPAETKKTLEDLVKLTTDLSDAVKNKATDEKLKPMIFEAHDIFHKIVGECRKTEE